MEREERKMELEMFGLPQAMRGEADIPGTLKMMARVEERLASLRAQKAYFDMWDILSTRFPMIESFSFEVGESWNDEGMSDHIEMTIQYQDPHDGLLTAAPDPESECGAFEREGRHLEGFRSYVDGLSGEIQLHLAGSEINCKNPRALAVAMMGEKGYAAFEAAQLSQMAEAGAPKGMSPRI